MFKFSAIATILIGILFASSCSTNSVSVLAELDAANKESEKALMAGDIDSVVDDYTDDACIIAPMAGETCGKEAIRAFWKSALANKPKKVEIITEKAESEGNLAFATGQLVITDADSAVHKSRFVVVFKKVGGQWKLRVDTWNPQ